MTGLFPIAGGPKPCRVRAAGMAMRLLLVIVIGPLGGCNPAQDAPPDADEQYSAPGGQSAGSSPVPLNVSSQPISLTPPGRTAAAAEIVMGDGQFVGPGARSRGTRQIELIGADVTLDFANVDIRDVLKNVLGDLLQLSYTVDPSVQGNITLQTGRPIPRSQVIDVLNTTLGLSGVALVNRNGLYLAVPVANALRQAPLGAETGFVTRIVPLQYVTANELQLALEPLTPPGATVKADPSRNAIIVSGSARDVASILENISAFDVDYLRGMSFALIPLANGKARDVANDVLKLVKASSRSVSDMVTVVPIERMNAVLVTSMQPAYLARVRAWVERFDRGDGRADQQLFVYRVQNGRATDIARVLRRALGIDASEGSRGDAQSSGASESDVTQPAPGTTSSNGTDIVQSTLAGTMPAAGSPQMRSDPLASVGTAAALVGGASASATDVRITADRTNNALIVSATGQDYVSIKAAIEKLDIPPLQVLIEATVAEVTLSNQLQFGLQYAFNSGAFKGIFAPNLAPANRSGTGQTFDNTFPGFGFLSGFNFGYSSGGTNIVLQALSQLTTIRVLSSPNLLVLNNGTARLQVGDQVPIATQSAQSTLTNTAQTVNSIAYKDTGVILNITPRVNASGLVVLDVTEEISQAGNTSTSALVSPTISQRRVTSTVAVNDGETIGLAGLITDSRQNGTAGIPVLKDIPIVGWLFGVRSDTVKHTELIMLITPHVIRGREDANAATQELRQKLRLTVPIVARQR
jgi:general secretion pathway protein D